MGIRHFRILKGYLSTTNVSSLLFRLIGLITHTTEPYFLESDALSRRIIRDREIAFLLSR